MPTIAIIVGGIFNVSFAVFHLFFWRLFDWKHDLASLSFINRQVMQVLNLCLAFAFLIFAYISLFHTTALMHTNLGQALLLLISLFWLLRAAEQVIFFGLKNTLSVVFFAVFLFGGILYAYPWFIMRAL
jgi:hypothetical protein